MKQRSIDRFKKDERLIATLQKNNAYYQRLINDKLIKQFGLERSMHYIMKNIGVDWKTDEKKG